ncbi:MAG: TetR/AcrR family transcriptional regulator [Nitratireductor sp.]|nr:TetR/AcrR family transcriptional regulator [Nitratireductor sp.]
MNRNPSPSRSGPEPERKRARRGSARTLILDAAVQLIREKGFAATSVDDLCKAAGVTKGAFFHNFESKEALGVALAEYWGEMTAPMFAAAPYHQPADPLDRVLAYVDFRKELVQGGIPDFSCVAGTLSQETYGEYPAIREACGNTIFGHAATLEPDFAEAIEEYGVTGTTAPSLARHTQAVLQGAFIMAKAGGEREAVLDALSHLRRYLELLFGREPSHGHA